MPDEGSAPWLWLPCSRRSPNNPLAPKPPHFAARAKAVIYLFMHGGVSHVDTFDPKPELTKRSGQTISAEMAKGLKTSRIDFAKAPDARQPLEVFQRTARAAWRFPSSTPASHPRPTRSR